MFRKSKKEKSDDADALHAPNINDDNDAMWFNPKGSATSGGPNGIAHPGMGIPPGAPPTLRLSASPNLSSLRKSTKNSDRKRFSPNDLVAAISINDWSTVLSIIDQDPKVAGKNAQLTLKGQKTEGNPLLLLVISNPPVEVVHRMIKVYPSGASNTDRQGDRTALHWACIANANPLILEALTNANPAACRCQDKKFGRVPMHYLVVIAEDPEQVQVLMDAERRASLIKDVNQKTPIDLANDSSNPAKVDIVAVMQRKRQSTLFGALKGGRSRATSPGKYKSTEYMAEAPSMGGRARASSPGKYKSTEYMAEPPKSPKKYGSMPIAPVSPGKYASRESTRAPKSPGKHRDREGSSRGRRTTDAEGSSRGRRTVDAEGSSRGRRTVDGGKETAQRSRRRSTDEREGSSKPRRNRSTRDRESKGDHRKRRSSRADGGMAKDSKALQDVVVSDIEDSGEFLAPPTKLTQSQSMGGNSASSFPPSRSISPVPSRSRSPMHSISPPPIVHGSPMAISDRNSTTSRPSNQSLTAGMTGEMRTLRDKLERKKRALEDKNREIAQIDDQLQDNKEESEALYFKAQHGGAAAPVNDRKLAEKRDKVRRLKDKIAELQSELRKAERDVKGMETSGQNMDMGYIQSQMQSKDEERSSLQFVKEALVQEKLAAQREVDNVESELKSLETIQMLAKDDTIG